MKFLTCLLVLAAVALSQASKAYYDLSEAPALFEKFINDYNKIYNDEADKSVHYEEFVKSLEEINQANAESPSAIFDINEFSDYTPEQRNNMFGFRFDGLHN